MLRGTAARGFRHAARSSARWMSGESALERFQQSEADLIKTEVASIQRLASVPASIRDAMQKDVERRDQLLRQIGDFAEVLSDHDLLGDEDSDLIQLLRGRDRAASGTGLIDPRAEIARLEELSARLRARLDDVEAVLGANPC